MGATVSGSFRPDFLRGGVFLLVAVLLLVAAAMAGARAARFVRQSTTGEGQVTRLLAGPSHPEIKFVTRAGQAVTYLQGGAVFGYRESQAVTVRYDPAAPRQSATVDTFAAIWGVTLVLGLLGGVLGLFGLSVVLSAARPG